MLFSNMCETFSRLYHMLGRKTGLSRLQKNEIIKQKEILKTPNVCQLNNTFLITQGEFFNILMNETKRTT